MSSSSKPSLRTAVIAASLAFELLLSCAYIFFISPLFQYAGFTYAPPGIWRMIVIHALALAPACWLPGTIEKPSQVVEWILYLSVIVPAVILPQYVLSNQVFPLLELGVTLVVASAMLHLGSKIAVPDLRLRGASQNMLPLAVSAAAVLLAIAISIKVGFNFSLVSLAHVYRLRSQFTEQAEGSSFLAYAVPWLGEVCAPFLLAVGIFRRKWLLAMAGIGCSLLVYSITGFKSVLLAPVLIFGVKKVLEFGKQKSGLLFPLAVCAVMLVCLAVDAVVGLPLMNSLFVHRLLIMPGVVTGYYFDFFSHHPFDMMSHSILRAFIQSPYAEPAPFIIGARYFMSAKADVNANIWATAYSDFGLAGIIVFSFLLAAVLRLYDLLTRALDLRLACMLIVFPAMILANTGLSTFLLTHGFLFTLLLVALLPTSAPQAMAARSSNA